jgi:hypothetical protein
MFAQLRARTPRQLAFVLAIVLVAIAGVTAIATGHSDLGRSLVGLAIVLLIPVSLWLQRTNLPR